MAAPVLEARGIEKHYAGFTALRGVDLAVRFGMVHGLIGPNGSGKSTLLNAMAGSVLPDRGTITLAGADVTRLPPHQRVRRGLSITFQVTSIVAGLSAYDNVLLALQARGSWPTLMRSGTRRGLHEDVVRSLRQFNLLHQADSIAGGLSHGEQQWLELAMAMATRPRVLLLDEPTGGMSIEERRITGQLLARAKEHTAILIVEHDLDFIRTLCDVVTVLHEGAVLDEGTPEYIASSEAVRRVYVTRA